MSSVKVVDLNTEEVAKGSLNSNPVGVEVKEEAPVIDPIEEVKQEPEPVVDTSNEVIEDASADASRSIRDTAEPPKEEVKEEVKEKPKRQTQKDKMNCPKCFKEVSIKTYKYSHEKNCQGQLSERPVKPHAKPKAKQAPKPKPVPVYEEEEPQPPPVLKQTPKPPPPNPLTNIQQHYQLLQQQYMKQKQEKYNSLCQNMFTTKMKKR